MRIQKAGVLNDIAQLDSSHGGLWDAEKVGKLPPRSPNKNGGADPTVGQYIVSIVTDPRRKFVDGAAAQLRTMLRDTWGVDPAAAADPRAPLPVTLHYVDPAKNSRKFYRLEIEGTTLLIANGRIGSKGITHPRAFADEKGAIREYHARLREKIREGYQRSPNPPPPARMTYTEGASNKFYELSVEGSDLVIKNGRIGSAGVEHRKSFASEAGATREMVRRKAEKLAEGYVMERAVKLLDVQVAAAKAVKAVRADAPATPQIAAVAAPEKESDYPIVRSLAEWNALSPSDRETVLDDMQYFPERYPHLTSVEDVDEDKIAKEVKDPAQQKFARAMIKKVRDLGLETDSDYYPTVGAPDMRVNVYALKSGEVIGGYVNAIYPTRRHER